MLSWFRRAQTRATVGAHINGEGLALVSVEWDRGRKPCVTSASWQKIEESGQVARMLAAVVHEGGLTRARTNLALEDSEYQLLQMEAPRVAPSEMRAAVRWKLKELIDFHIDDAVIDVFEISDDENRPQGQATMYTVAARARQVRERIDLVEQSGLDLKVIDITEMALRNLAALMEEDIRGLATLYLARDHGILTITRQGNLYLARRLETGYQDLAGDDAEPLDRTLLEIQRSLDYYDRHFKQPPLAGVTVIPGYEGHEGLVAGLDAGLDLHVHSYNWTGLLDCREALPKAGLGSLLLATGAALRQEGLSL